MSDQQIAMLQQQQQGSPAINLMKMGAQYAAQPQQQSAPQLTPPGDFRQQAQKIMALGGPQFNYQQMQGLVPTMPAGSQAPGFQGATAPMMAAQGQAPAAPGLIPPSPMPGIGIPSLAQANPTVAPSLRMFMGRPVGGIQPSVTSAYNLTSA